MDKKGVLVYCGIVLALSYGLFGVFMALRIPALTYLVFGVPAAAAWVASNICPSKNYPRGTIWPIPRIPALLMALVIPAGFCISHVVVHLVYNSQIDLGIGELASRLPSAGQLQLPPAFATALPSVYLGMGIVLTVLLGPTFYAALMLAHEYGWRGYLLPRLLPLGRWPAHLVIGIIWAICFTPLILALSIVDPPQTHAVRGLLAALAFNAALGEVWVRTRRLGLAAVCGGCLICQASGMWLYLFPGATSVLPWGGRFDVNFTVVSIVAAVLLPWALPRWRPPASA